MLLRVSSPKQAPRSQLRRSGTVLALAAAMTVQCRKHVTPPSPSREVPG